MSALDLKEHVHRLAICLQADRLSRYIGMSADTRTWINAAIQCHADLIISFMLWATSTRQRTFIGGLDLSSAQEINIRNLGERKITLSNCRAPTSSYWP